MSTESLVATAPAPVRYAYRLWLVVLGIGLASLVVSEVVDPSSDFSSGREVAVYVAVLAIVLAFFALFGWFARKMRDGRNWARILLLVVMILTLPGLRDIVRPVTGVLDVVGIVLDVGTSVLAVVAVALSFSRPASPWFRRPPRPTGRVQP